MCSPPSPMMQKAGRYACGRGMALPGSKCTDEAHSLNMWAPLCPSMMLDVMTAVSMPSEGAVRLRCLNAIGSSEYSRALSS